MTYRTRKGSIVRSLSLSLVVLTVLLLGGFYGWKLLAGGVRVESAPQMVQVKRETFIHEILEKGSVESSINVDITCEVESVGGIVIIKIVEEGTDVKKGDLLVEFDSSTFQETVNKQAIAVLNSQAKNFQAEVDVKNAELELEEYKEGKYKELLKAAENKILKQKEEMRKAEDTLRFNSNLLARGYITESTVAAEEFKFRQAENDLIVAEMEKDNLIKYTATKTINSLEAKVAAAKAKMNSDQESLQLEKNRLEHLQKQLDKCKVYAPQDGQVVYAPPRWGDESMLIREGLKVYERQQIIKLPDPTKMQVKGLVNEASIRLVKPGDPATIELEAFPNQTFKGIVKTVNDYPEPTGWSSQGMAREYQTTVTVLDPPAGIKPGLTAKVKIIVNVIPGALTLPIQAVFEYDKKMYCVTYNEGKWDKIEVKTGPTNDKQVVIESGLEEGDVVVLNAWQNREKLNLPKIDKEEEYSGPLQNEFDNQSPTTNTDKPRERGGTRGPKPAAEKSTEASKDASEKQPEKVEEAATTPEEKTKAKSEAKKEE
ncbi:MAG: efflux RND transporter periplasmic adaptor subunit [Planctomycetaceae bacterium]|nr:efflux RND transporter periplasmic adaptor subunit [Planctomycetaceae bacterium]